MAISVGDSSRGDHHQTLLVDPFRCLKKYFEMLSLAQCNITRLTWVCTSGSSDFLTGAMTIAFSCPSTFDCSLVFFFCSSCAFCAASALRSAFFDGLLVLFSFAATFGTAVGAAGFLAVFLAITVMDEKVIRDAKKRRNSNKIKLFDAESKTQKHVCTTILHEQRRKHEIDAVNLMGRSAPSLWAGKPTFDFENSGTQKLMCPSLLLSAIFK